MRRAGRRRRWCYLFVFHSTDLDVKILWCRCCSSSWPTSAFLLNIFFLDRSFLFWSIFTYHDDKYVVLDRQWHCGSSAFRVWLRNCLTTVIAGNSKINWDEHGNVTGDVRRCLFHCSSSAAIAIRSGTGFCLLLTRLYRKYGVIVVFFDHLLQSRKV